MQTLLEVIKFNANDIVTTSTSSECTYEDCPSLEWDDQATEG